MSSFFNGVWPNFGNRDVNIKNGLLANLSENAKEIQFEQQQQPHHQQPQNLRPINLCDATNSLCTTMEAIFLHGLKDSFLRQTINVIAGGGGEVDRRPEPNFWPPLLIFTHKQTIEQIQGLSQVTTDIGHSRSWIRQSLNDGLLSSYLTNIRKNQSALSPYYKNYAFLRDADMIVLAEAYVGGIEACTTFALPINSSLLNQWTYHPLQMAGLYTPPLKSFVISSGIDVANTLPPNDIPIPKPVQTNEMFAESITNSPFATSPIMNLMLNKNNNQQSSQSPTSRMHRQIPELNDDDNLALLLNKIDKGFVDDNGDDAEMAIESKEMTSSVMGNSIISKTCWSCDTKNDNDAGGDEQMLSRSNSVTTSITSLRSPIDRYSYNSLLARHNRDGIYSKTVDLKEVWDRFESSLSAGNKGIIGTSIQQQKPNDDTDIDNTETMTDLGFEFIRSDVIEKFSLDELQQFVKQTCHIANEKGIDAQGFICKSCPNPLGVGNNVAQACALTGFYYCDRCMNDETFLIPARIIYNWDFRKFHVSRRAALFLIDFQQQPFIDLKLLCPNIYAVVDEMASLQSLRIQLNFIRAYLFTCCATIIENFQKLMWSNEYLYEHIHRYSIGDLQQIPNGALTKKLQKAVQFGREHILDCRLCSQKGFICEICNSAKVLYPFDIETTFRCELCGAVFHDQCLNASHPCPKCERKRKREDLPLLDAVNNLSAIQHHNFI